MKSKIYKKYCKMKKQKQKKLKKNSPACVYLIIILLLLSVIRHKHGKDTNIKILRDRKTH